LDFGLSSSARDGWRRELIAAELAYDRKFFEQERSWSDLNQNLSEARQHLELSRKLETIQEAKLKSERNRLQHGRTTTYQVMLFEQDYILSQLTRIRDQANVLNIIAQMKLFGENL
jgi:outer membrane protein TolC